ncbi:MAG: polysaccharide biosynthesis/export family protein [Syntrophobacteraceae bacterium]
MKNSIRRATVIIILVFLSSCYSGPVVLNPTPVGAPGTQVVQTDQEYIINVGDKLNLKFFYNPELNEEIDVRPDGRISLQLVQEVVAAGRTPAELTKELKEKYSSDLTNPEVTVIVRSFNAHKVFVDGEVGKPGLVGLVGSMTVLQAIANSGGLKETARPNEVVIIRKGPDGKPMAIPVNLQAVISGTDINQDIGLAPYDIVYVPKSNIAMTDKWMDEYVTKTVGVFASFAYWYGLFR